MARSDEEQRLLLSHDKLHLRVSLRHDAGDTRGGCQGRPQISLFETSSVVEELERGSYLHCSEHEHSGYLPVSLRCPSRLIKPRAAGTLNPDRSSIWASIVQHRRREPQPPKYEAVQPGHSIRQEAHTNSRRGRRTTSSRTAITFSFF